MLRQEKVKIQGLRRGLRRSKLEAPPQNCPLLHHIALTKATVYGAWTRYWGPVLGLKHLSLDKPVGCYHSNFAEEEMSYRQG